jgi:predicted Zn-dependent protease
MTMDYGYGRRRGGRLPIRFIIAGIIALIAIITYYSRTERNPVTGEKQRVAMNVDQEKVLGLQAAPQMAAKMGGVLPTADPRAALVEQVGRRIVQRSDASRSPYVESFNFHLLNDPQTVNAFALPGGQIFITLALFNRLEDEAQLAGVLGHEIGHVINRHAAEHMAKGQLGQMLVGAVVVGASDDRSRGQMAAMTAMMANQMLQLRYSRKDELESDDYGLKYMAQAGYDPTQMLRVMEILKEASGGRGGASILATHPDPDARIEKIKEYLSKNYPGGIPPELSKGRSFR